MSRSVGIVVPAYRPNPERLASYLRALDDEFAGARLHVELDDPDERTVEVLSESPATVSVTPYRRGKGAAITAGFERLDADVDVLAFADADGSTPPSSFAAVVGAAVDGRADLAAGSRRHPDSTVESHQTFARRRLGDGFAWLARRLLDADLYDYQCGAKAISADAWDRVREHLYAPGFAWDIELVAMAAAMNRDVEEVPITWQDQPGSTVSPVRTSLRMARALFTARHRAKRVRDSQLHTAIAARREQPKALVERE